MAYVPLERPHRRHLERAMNWGADPDKLAHRDKCRLRRCKTPSARLAVLSKRLRHVGRLSDFKLTELLADPSAHPHSRYLACKAYATRGGRVELLQQLWSRGRLRYACYVISGYIVELPKARPSLRAQRVLLHFE